MEYSEHLIVEQNQIAKRDYINPRKRTYMGFDMFYDVINKFGKKYSIDVWGNFYFNVEDNKNAFVVLLKDGGDRKIIATIFDDTEGNFSIRLDKGDIPNEAHLDFVSIIVAFAFTPIDYRTCFRDCGDSDVFKRLKTKDNKYVFIDFRYDNSGDIKLRNRHMIDLVDNHNTISEFTYKEIEIIKSILKDVELEEEFFNLQKYLKSVGVKHEW